MSYEKIAAAIRAERDRVESTPEEREQGMQVAADAIREYRHPTRKDATS